MSANTLFLFHCEGADGATPATDDSTRSNALTYAGACALTAGDSKFGSTSLRVGAATADIMYTLCSAYMTMGTGNWTVELWIKKQTGVQSWRAVMGWGDLGTTSEMSIIGYHGATPWWMYADFNNISNTNSYTYPGGTSPDMTVWHHLAHVRNGTKIRFFIDGNQTTALGTRTFTGSMNAPSATSLISWSKAGSGATVGFDGWIDEIRISDIARWTANFTPATAAYGPAPSAGGDTSFGLSLDIGRKLQT